MNQSHPSSRSRCDFTGARVLVMGLGRLGGGVGASRWLARQGADVTVTDAASRASLAESVRALSDLPIRFRFGPHEAEDLAGIDLVVVNPAVHKARSAFFAEIANRGIPWTTELNLFCERCRGCVIGVTGTYGKSTTCAMLAEVLNATTRASHGESVGVFLGGNIGGSLLGELHRIGPADWVVLELSNAQLEDLPHIAWAPQYAVITNVSPHHLERHGTYAEYVRAKLAIIGPPDRTRRVFVGDLDAEARGLVRLAIPDSAQRLVRFTVPDPALRLRIPGEHNQNNAACVLAVAKELGVDDAPARAAIESFAGLPHRLQHVRTLRGVTYLNDSKSTSPSATMTALKTIRGGIVAIVGGQKKDDPLAECALALVRACHAVICVGGSGPSFHRELRGIAGVADCVIHSAPDLTTAVTLAQREARSGDTVLFSPGAPSFDAYPNFVARGERFMDAVHALT